MKVRLIAVVVLAAAAMAGIAALLLNIAERKREAKTHYLELVKLTDDTIDPPVRRIPPNRRYPAHPARRQRGISEARRGSPLAPDLQGLCLRARLPRGARSCLHALGPG